MAKRVEDYLNHQFSTGTVPGEDYMAFQRTAKADLKKKAEAAGYILYVFIKNHYCFSAVLRDEQTGKFAYVSIRDVRNGPHEWYQEVLYRTMSHDRDYRGGNNHYCPWSELADRLVLLRQQRKD